MKPLQILIKAKELLNKKPTSWIKWSLYNGDGGYCAVGAMYTVAKSQGFEVAANHSYLGKAARKVADELGRPLTKEVRGSRKGRQLDAAFFNNTATDISEINKMFCKAIEMAIEDELKEEVK